MRAIAALLLFAGTSCAVAQLRWENPRQAFSVKPGEQSVNARYRFTNRGDAPVVIQDVQTSCGCTTATLSKKEYAPGESGEIDARFEVGSRVGHQEKEIVVTSREGTQPSTATLLLDVDIPELVKVEPQVLLWRVGPAPETKTIEVTVSPECPSLIASVRSDAPGVKINVVGGLPGKKVTLQITPPATVSPHDARIFITMDRPADRPETHTAYIKIR